MPSLHGVRLVPRLAQSTCRRRAGDRQYDPGIRVDQLGMDLGTKDLRGLLDIHYLVAEVQNVSHRRSPETDDLDSPIAGERECPFGGLLTTGIRRGERGGCRRPGGAHRQYGADRRAEQDSPYRGLFPSPPLFDRMPTYRTQGKRSLNFLSAKGMTRAPSIVANSNFPMIELPLRIMRTL